MEPTILLFEEVRTLVAKGYGDEEEYNFDEGFTTANPTFLTILFPDHNHLVDELNQRLIDHDVPVNETPSSSIKNLRRARIIELLKSYPILDEDDRRRVKSKIDVIKEAMAGSGPVSTLHQAYETLRSALSNEGAVNESRPFSYDFSSSSSTLHVLKSLSSQMERIHRMHLTLLEKKEAEISVLREKCTFQQDELQKKALEIAVLNERSSHQKQRIQEKDRGLERTNKTMDEQRKELLQKSVEIAVLKERNASNSVIPSTTKDTDKQQTYPQEPIWRKYSTKNSISTRPDTTLMVSCGGPYCPSPDMKADSFATSKIANTGSVVPVLFIPPMQRDTTYVNDNIPYEVLLDDHLVTDDENVTLATFDSVSTYVPSEPSIASPVTVPSVPSPLINDDDRGKEQQRVAAHPFVDAYGRQGSYTGLLLRSTGMPHGPGRMRYDEDGQSVYEGDWHHGRHHGFGHRVFANGDVYEGEYHSDRQHGHGEYRWKDGSLYKGSFVDGKYHGEGTFTWTDGSKYEGNFFKGSRDGEGHFTDGEGGYYEGSWLNDSFNGYGERHWADGRVYRGEWKGGKAHGLGIQIFSDGWVRHDGEWNNDEPVLLGKGEQPIETNFGDAVDLRCEDISVVTVERTNRQEDVLQETIEEKNNSSAADAEYEIIHDTLFDAFEEGQEQQQEEEKEEEEEKEIRPAPHNNDHQLNSFKSAPSELLSSVPKVASDLHHREDFDVVDMDGLLSCDSFAIASLAPIKSDS